MEENIMGIFVSEKNILRCPKCGGTYFKDDGFSTCIDDGCDLITENEYRSYNYPSAKPTVECPYCHSIGTKKISGASKAGSIALFGFFAMPKASKQWHCNKCKSDF